MHRGLNQQADLADPYTQCVDTKNMWAPAGKLEQRPGYVGISTTGPYFDASAITTVTSIKESPLGTFTTTTTLDNLAVGRRWYFGIDTIPAATDKGVGLGIYLSGANSNGIGAGCEYWNGVEWTQLQGFSGTGSRGPVAQQAYFLNPLGANLYALFFPWPADLAQTTVNASAAYFFRFTLFEAGASAFDAAVEVGAVPNHTILKADESTVTFRSFFLARFPFTKRYVGFDLNSGSTDSVYFRNSDQLEAASPGPTTSGGSVYPECMPLAEWSYTVIPEFEEAYFHYNRRPFKINAYPSTTTSAGVTILNDSVEPAVEVDPLLVGPEMRYDKDQLIQLVEWPKSKYTTFFQGQLWVANTVDSPYEVRWSAPLPFYKVWPGVNYEVLIEDDDSPITGLRGFGQHMLVFKNDSIWRMVDTGIVEDPVALQTYAPDKIVTGVGCVSNSGIQNIQGRLIFPAEDGLYAFDGQNVLNIGYDPKTGADRISEFFKSITPGQRPYMVSANWKKHHCYLLSASVDGSMANNRVLVWDYKNDSFWVWDDICVHAWIGDEDSADNEHLYFVDAWGRIYEFGVGNTNHGGTISSYAKSQRLGRDFDETTRARQFQVESANTSNAATLTVFTEDEPTGISGTLSFTDAAEDPWGTMVFGADAWTTVRRRLKRLMFRRDGDWFQVQIAHNTKNTSFECAGIYAGVVPLGVR